MNSLSAIRASRGARPAAKHSFPGTLKTSLCATRVFPTPDCPASNALRLPAGSWAVRSLNTGARPAAKHSFPGTLKTSLCATRVFPTPDCPASNALRLPAASRGSALHSFAHTHASAGGGGFLQRPRVSGTHEERPGMARAFAGKTSTTIRAEHC